MGRKEKRTPTGGWGVVVGGGGGAFPEFFFLTPFVQNFITIGQPLLGEKYVAEKRKKKEEK
jgi:hypothetical protein